MLAKTLHEPVTVGIILLFFGLLFYRISVKIRSFKINRVAKKICDKLNEGLLIEPAIAQVIKTSTAYFCCDIKTETADVVHIHIEGLVEDTSHDIYFEKDEYPFADKNKNEWFFKKLTTTLHKEHYDKITT